MVGGTSKEKASHKIDVVVALAMAAHAAVAGQTGAVELYEQIARNVDAGLPSAALLPQSAICYAQGYYSANRSTHWGSR